MGEHQPQGAGDQEGEHGEQGEQVGDEVHPAVAAKVAQVTVTILLAAAEEHPAEVGVGQSPQGAAQAAAVAVRSVGIAVGVREGVVLAVVRHPGDQRALEGQRAENCPHVAQAAIGLKRTVGEQAVVADPDAETREDVERDHDPEIGGGDSVAPQEPDRHRQPEKGQDHPDELGDLLIPGHARAHV